MIKSLLESDAHLPEALTIAGQQLRVTLRRNPRARRYILRFNGPLNLLATLPRGGSKRDAWAFIMRSQTWIRRQLEKRAAASQATAEIFLRGEKFALETSEHFARIGAEIVPLNGELHHSIQRHFHNLAVAELIPRTRELAVQTNTEIRRITVRNQRSRWGSCSLRRTISLNWRLIQTPDFVRDYIILHELMHVREMNHSPKFWAEVESVCPAWRDAEKWLRANGRQIMSAAF